MSAAPGEVRAWIWTGARFEPTQGIPVTDRGFRYGMSLFESFPVRNGIALFLKQHIARLEHACKVTGLQPPAGALEQCASVLHAAGDGFGRIYITAGDGPAGALCDISRVLIFVEQRDPVHEGLYLHGYTLGIHPGGHVPLFGGLKTGNYWANLNAYRDGVENQCNQTLLFTPAGHLISACMANVFIVKNDSILTPALTTGARNGTIREWVMQQTPVEEALLSRADVESADEIFLTNSWLGIMPAHSINGRLLDHRHRKVSPALLYTYQKETSEHR